MSGLSLGLGIGAQRAGGIGWPPSITSSDGETATLVDNGDDTVDVVINSVVVGTITRAQVEAGGFITVVEPVVGMNVDGVTVELQTVGYVIHVGSTPIETDVEVLADGVVVGTALPFDATAYPDALLNVRFSYSVGGVPFAITLEARAAPLKIAQFRDSYMAFAGQGSSDEAYPTASRTRRMTLAIRITGNFNTSATPADNVGAVFLDGPRLQNNRFGGANNGTIRSQSPDPFETLGTTVSWAGGASQNISFLIAIDYDGGLPGGETFTVWWSRNGAAPSKLTGQTAPPPDGRLAYVTSMGNPNTGGTQVGGTFDVHNHLWVANEALDPEAHFSTFFNSDGTVKPLPVDGVVAGVTPVIFLVGNDFNTGNNRGSGNDITFFNTAGGRTKPNVVTA